METIIELRQSTKKRLLARFDGQDLVKNIANCGISKGETATVTRTGIYKDFTVQAQENYPPLITTDVAINAIQKILNGDVMLAMHLLHLNTPGETYFILNYWLQKYEFSVPDIIKDNNVEPANEREYFLKQLADSDVGSTLPFTLLKI